MALDTIYSENLENRNYVEEHFWHGSHICVLKSNFCFKYHKCRKKTKGTTKKHFKQTDRRVVIKPCTKSYMLYRTPCYYTPFFLILLNLHKFEYVCSLPTH